MSRALVEGFAPDAIGLARTLAATGDDVRLAGPGAARPLPSTTSSPGSGSVSTPTPTSISTTRFPTSPTSTSGHPEVAPRVTRLRAAGVRLSCLSELVLACSTVRTIGITGTAGKTTTSSFLVQLLRTAGVRALAADQGYAGQLWATEELLAAIAPNAPSRYGVALLELTSSHLAFCAASPTVAVVTSFWPDHLELHGSLDAYRAAKERIVATQRAGDRVVVNVDDPAAAGFAERTRRRTLVVLRRSRGRARRLPPRRDGRRAHRPGGRRPRRRPRPARRPPPRRARCSRRGPGRRRPAPAHCRERSADSSPPRFRADVVGRRGATLLVDDGMAATPAKAAATLRSFPDRSVVLVAGGEIERDGLRLHATAAERELLERALDEVARAARHVVTFGPAASELAPRLAARDTPATADEDLDAAIERALAHAATDPPLAALVVAPMFALTLAERERAAAALRAAADR